MTVIELPEPSLVVMIGAAGSGKSTFAARHFEPTDTLSSDAFRQAIAGDAADQSASRAAFAALHASLDRRMRASRSAVVDATNLTRSARRRLLASAAAAHIPAIAVVLDVEPEVVLRRNADRANRVVPEDVVRRHLREVRRLVDEGSLDVEGFERVVVLRGVTGVDAAAVQWDLRARADDPLARADDPLARADDPLA